MLPTTRLLSATPRKLCGTPPNEHLSPTQLCRALLREASYLPDQTAREYFHRFVLWRFRSYQPIDKASVWFREINQKPRKRLLATNIDLRASEKLRKGRQALSLLRRANNGELEPLRKVLLAAYGRTGRRRHELIKPLLQPTIPENSDALEAIMKGTPGNNKKPLQELYHDDSRVLSFFDAPKGKSADKAEIRISKEYPQLDAVIQANGQYRPSGNPRQTLRSTSLTAPTTNIWGRPMPVKRAKNMVKEWYKNAMEKMLPPLPKQEWDRLHSLALGDIKCEPISRRSLGTVRPERASREPGSEIPLGLLEQSDLASELGLAKRRLLHGLYPPNRNRITPRFMQRLYQDVAGLCCKLVWDSGWNKWTVVWGSAAAKEHLRRVWSEPVETDLFAGVDERGRLPKPPKNVELLQNEADLQHKESR
ncbi:uncharacterized protein BDZ99DRAFT_374743 [Mytilinidion resinicola]|uniref:LYR motif-containing protein Cup1-like N-terminal domain-containing protein n=1 Tax=Mytilinidion resinicola TaxID=574789 RepID=A0A6A6Z9Y1_9PEZI|nr:uncharacterized protein BDZ99DRAFT_374743 [Mytilinidion resinicola]KAF2817543.1 hypothetical protein BDZ99DRAFT_374743 [Mytilinidion resinicola]